MKAFIDQAGEVREKEKLPERELEIYIKKQIPDLEGTLNILQFKKGYSNLTYLLKFDNKEFVLRRAPFGANVKSGHDMSREYKILKALHPHFKKVPKPILYSGATPFMDTSFYLMEKMEGVILRKQMPKDMIPKAQLMKNISTSFVDAFVELHQLDYASMGLEGLGKPIGYAERQIVGWKKRYTKAKTEEIEEVESVADYLEKSIPQNASIVSLIHNDFKYDNLVLDPQDWTKVRAILDWEMCTLGDPLMDLGTTLAYWINHNDPDWMKMIALNPTYLPGNPTRAEVIKMYEQKSGTRIENPVFYYVYGLFKIIGITQQISYRFRNGHTNDPRFAHLDQVVKNLAKVAIQAIEKDEV